MDFVFKEGMVYLYGVKFGKKTWRKTWMALFKASSTGVGRLELSNVSDGSSAGDQKKSGRQKSTERKVVRLSDCLSATPAVKESCPSGCTAFCLNTTQSTYIFASNTSEEWLSALCLLAFQGDPGGTDKGDFEGGNSLAMEDNELYSTWNKDPTLPPKQFKVKIKSTIASKRCKLAGEYLMSSETEALVLFSLDASDAIFRWPYRLLRRFGKVEGGFSIEAGRRCESGEGLFIFLTRHALHVFQAIAKQCSVDIPAGMQPVNDHRRSLCDPSLAIPAAAKGQTFDPPDVDADTDDESDGHYSLITEPAQKFKPQSFLKCDSKERPSEDEDEYGLRLSVEALNLESVIDDSVYYNLKKDAPPLRLKSDIDDSESIYSDVKIRDSPLDPRPESLYAIVAPPVPPVPPSFILCPVPKRRSQFLSPVDNQLEHNKAQPADDTREEEDDATSSVTRNPPTEAPGTFKHKLAEILSKDVTKLQPPLPLGGASSSFSQ
ncbi:docking protein 3 [Oryzias latipes]|uniref:IRS-type PTB domain-containing protein n=1 Tax=Oryzias latipes TaxID=8090 RepID=A0A3B3IJH7_ORYLA|nr:docking protein 3 [Oryzias latipes]